VADAISWGDVRIAAVIDWACEVPDAIGLLPGPAARTGNGTGAGCPPPACGIQIQIGGV